MRSENELARPWVRAELEENGTWTIRIAGGVSPGHKTAARALAQIRHAMAVIEYETAGDRRQKDETG